MSSQRTPWRKAPPDRQSLARIVKHRAKRLIGVKADANVETVRANGYAIMEAKSREEALALARRFMELHLKHWPTFESECEVRPLEEEAQPAS